MSTMRMIALAMPIAALAMLTGACRSASDALGGRASEPIALTVLHTNDVWGQTEPCG
jgi:hypothetical protein